MANSDQLRTKRGAIRAGVTRALTLLTDLLQQPDPDASQISGHMDYLKAKETALSQLDDVILATTDEENLDQEVGTVQEYNEKILYAVSRAKFRLQERERNAGTQARATEPGPSYLGSPNSGDAAGQGLVHDAKNRNTFGQKHEAADEAAPAEEADVDEVATTVVPTLASTCKKGVAFSHRK
ncbi:hypothetical protein HPB52_022684 [Rhipicephalus sanguineus]|uniref:Uncharacterized protein n=1 Tax=Rhipicephalus sanguineus TaxID=34632 RepID=A0A9D4SXS3_RHISA|nr:hypothetical protein HPB52_022684 [Rhipicephalus sanguineus]